MLIEEHQSYENEFLSSAKTPLERQAELRERAKQIRIKGANEQAEFVQKKLDQKWRQVKYSLFCLRSICLENFLVAFSHILYKKNKQFNLLFE